MRQDLSRPESLDSRPALPSANEDDDAFRDGAYVNHLSSASGSPEVEPSPTQAT
jgi:hypothetical protein